MGEHEKSAVLKVLNGNHSRHYVGKLLSGGRSKDASAKHKALKKKLGRSGIDFKAIERDQKHIDSLPNKGRVK